MEYAVVGARLSPTGVYAPEFGSADSQAVKEVRMPAKSEEFGMTDRCGAA
ncbi:MAG: hypothetical protein JWN03_5991 [Nocardia sp.]|nr:hypothetical protein [Nocardia sp.]